MPTDRLTHWREALLAGLLAFLLAACHGSTRERDEALAFLYAYMPLPDSVDHPRTYWERCVDATLRARDEMPWGRKVPEREWRHFVLPVRVNNESLDDARSALYDSLRDRVRGKSMYGAILEVNHWCHERVTYQPSDSRTCAPLTTMASAIGRCGEESTFTVAALRAVGIPARQVYTPRWAHTDDNHAWVEAWADGTWYFLGACEPEPALNMGWFASSATRGMIMHTKVFGHYEGKEEVVGRNACYTEINVTQNYAAVNPIYVHVTDTAGKPVEGAVVDYRLYNYAEFHTLASKRTDKRGESELTCGKGDLLVWASKGRRFGFAKASVGRDTDVRVVLDKDASFAASVDMELNPPRGADKTPDVSAGAVRANKRALAREDSLRADYERRAFHKARKGDTHQSAEVRARANWRVVADYRNSPEARTRTGGVLATLRDKDLRDVTLDVLLDAARHTAFMDSPLWMPYVLCPRVSDETLTPCRAELGKAFKGTDARALARWVRDSVRVDDSRNPQRLPMSPLGVYRHRTADTHSRDIFYVAAARSAGIIARLDEVTGKVQWADKAGVWHDVTFGGEAPESARRGTLRLAYRDTDIKENPSYYTHFTLSRIADGRPRLCEYPEGTTWSGGFAEGAPVDEGQYLLVSGTRLSSGGVLAHLEFFPVAADETKEVPLTLRRAENRLQVIGSFDCGLGFTNSKGKHRSILQSAGRGYYLVALIGSNHEPSVHLLREFEEANIYLSQWPHQFLMLFPTREEFKAFRRKDYDELPENFAFGLADAETVRAMHIKELSRGSNELPLLMICDTFNRVVWFHQGYTIGLGERVMEVIRTLIYEGE